MGFTDFLKPKYGHSDPSVRKRGVASLEDQDILETIAKNDEDENVREVAIKKLKDQAILVDLMKNEKIPRVRMAVFKKIEGQAVLADIAKYDMNQDIRLAAIKRLEGQTILTDSKSVKSTQTNQEYYDVFVDGTILSGCKEVDAKEKLAQLFKINIIEIERRLFSGKLAVVKKQITRKNAELYKKAINKAGANCIVKAVIEERKETVKQTPTLPVLVDIAKNDQDKTLRIEAIRRLEDQSILAGIVKDDEDIEIRLAALKKLEDQTKLANIAKKNENETVRITAIEMLTNQSILEDIALNEDEESVRAASVKKIENQSILADIAKYDEADIVRMTVIEKLKDESILTDIVKHSDFKIVREAAFKKVKGEAFLEDIAENAQDEDSSAKAKAAITAIKEKKAAELKLRQQISTSEDLCQTKDCMAILGPAFNVMLDEFRRQLEQERISYIALPSTAALYKIIPNGKCFKCGSSHLYEKLTVIYGCYIPGKKDKKATESSLRHWCERFHDNFREKDRTGALTHVNLEWLTDMSNSFIGLTFSYYADTHWLNLVHHCLESAYISMGGKIPD